MDTFINAIYLYDDKVLITFNYKEGTETVAFGEAVKAEKSSDMSAQGAPDIERKIVRFDVLFCYVTPKNRGLHGQCTVFARSAFSLLRLLFGLETFPFLAGLGGKLWQKERGLDDASPLVGHNCAITAPISAWMQTDCRWISGGQTACP